MREYNDIYTEEVKVASPYRRAYLDSVNTLLREEGNKREEYRNSYMTKEKLRNNRQFYVSELKNLIGAPLIDRKNGTEVKKEYVSTDSMGAIYRMTFTFDRNVCFYGLLFVPFERQEGKIVFALHGGESTPEMCSDIYQPNYYSHMARRVMDRGFTVFAPQLLMWNKAHGNRFDRYETDGAFRQIGGRLVAFEMECLLGCLDWFEKNGYGTFGTVGLSYGAYYAALLSALDERMKVCYSSCILNDRLRYARPDIAFEKAADKMLDAEMFALISPRKLYIEAGRHDCFFRPESAEAEFERLKKLYDAPETSLVFKITEMGHILDEDDAGFDFLAENM